MLNSKGVKSFLTTMKIHFYIQNECHSSKLYPIILRSAFRDQAVKRCNNVFKIAKKYVFKVWDGFC